MFYQDNHHQCWKYWCRCSSSFCCKLIIRDPRNQKEKQGFWLQAVLFTQDFFNNCPTAYYNRIRHNIWLFCSREKGCDKESCCRLWCAESSQRQITVLSCLITSCYVKHFTQKLLHYIMQYIITCLQQ